jgi:signal peptidase I
MRKLLVSVLEVAEVVVVALGAVFVVRSFLVQPFLVSGASMAPSFENGNYLLVDELTYRFRPPERGEVVVFRYPNDESTYFIKRIVGLPGDRIVIKDGVVTVVSPAHPEGERLTEPYLAAGMTTAVRRQDEANVTLGPGEYFVLGDNRSYSFDSRDWGPLKTTEIIGLVRLRLWPLTGLTVFAAPRYST